MESSKFILILLSVCLLSVTTSNLMTVKPTVPKYTQVKVFYHENDSENVGVYIYNKTRNGWILKDVEGANNGTNESTWIVVMEKY